MKIGKTIVAGMAAMAALITGALAAPVPINVNDDAGKALTGDPDHGATIFKQCMVCHSIKEGENRVGPSLHGIIGRTAGSIPNFAYSTANKKSGITWEPQKLFVYLKNPQATVPGTKMTFPGLPKPEDRQDVIAYLEQNSK